MTEQEIYEELKAKPYLKDFMQTAINKNLTKDQLRMATLMLQELAKM